MKPFGKVLTRFLRKKDISARATSLPHFGKESTELLNSIAMKCTALSIFLGLIDAAVVIIARAAHNEEHNIAYNSHKRRHSLKYHNVLCADDIILYAHSPFQGLLYEWALYFSRNMSNQLEEIRYIGGLQYFAHGGS